MSPRGLQQARDENDKNCGGDAARMPCVDGMVRMPYLCAFVKEVLRWRPTVSIVLPHRLTQDMEFEGYLFPADTEFIINEISLGNSRKHFSTKGGSMEMKAALHTNHGTLVVEDESVSATK